MNVHHHIEHPFLCVKSTPFGWAVTEGECRSEMVEMCAEMIVGDVRFLPDQDALFQALRGSGARDEDMQALRAAMGTG